MQDDKTNNEDFDDLEFEDFEESDTLDDDLLADDENLDDISVGDDELDDEQFNDGWEEAGAQKGKPSKKSGGKGSSSKLVLPLAVGAVLLGGGAYYFTQMGGMPAGAPIDLTSPQGTDIADSDLPMPSPIAPPEQDGAEFTPDYAQSIQGDSANTQDNADIAGTPDLGVQDAQQPVPADPSALTPMPSLQAIEDGTNEPTVDSIDITGGSNTGQDSAGVPTEDTALLDQPPALIGDVATDALSETQETAPIETAESAAVATEAPEQAKAPSLSEIEATDYDSATTEIDTATPPVPAETLPATEASQDTGNQISEQAAVAAQEYEKKIATLETTLSSRQSEIDALNARIAELNAQINDKDRALEKAEKSLESAKSQPVAAAIATEKKAAPVPEDTKPVQALLPKEKPVAVKKPATAPKATAKVEDDIKPRWELRSAQPGRAYIGIIGAKDTQVVGVGDTLQGIGKVKDISQQNGRWVVQGTTGSIQQ